MEDSEDDILRKGDLSRFASCAKSFNDVEADEERRGKEFQNLGYVAELTNRVAFDGLSREHGMSIEAHPADCNGHLYKATTEQVQPDEARRLRAQGIEQKF